MYARIKVGGQEEREGLLALWEKGNTNISMMALVGAPDVV